jgi:hypothetical protein
MLLARWRILDRPMIAVVAGFGRGVGHGFGTRERDLASLALMGLKEDRRAAGRQLLRGAMIAYAWFKLLSGLPSLEEMAMGYRRSRKSK